MAGKQFSHTYLVESEGCWWWRWAGGGMWEEIRPLQVGVGADGVEGVDDDSGETANEGSRCGEGEDMSQNESIAEPSSSRA